MSGKVVGMVFDHYPASGGELLLAVKLADNAHEDGTRIFPSVAALADGTRQSERTVQYQLRRMVARGWLVQVREARGGGRGGGNGMPREYRIHADWIAMHDSRVDPEKRPQWRDLLLVDQKEMGANIAPISEAEKTPSQKEMGAIAVAEMGAIAVAPEPSLTVRNTNTPLPPTGGAGVADANPETPKPEAAPGFEAFWQHYPRKVDQEKARRAWCTLRPDATLQATITAALQVWTRHAAWQRNDGQFIPKPSNWLRGKRWQDMPDAAPVPPPAATWQPPTHQAAPVPHAARELLARLKRGQGRAVQEVASCN